MYNFKADNDKKLITILSGLLLFNLSIQYGFTFAGKMIQLVSLASILMPLLVVINVVPSQLKYKLIFLKCKNEMPACHADKLRFQDTKDDIRKYHSDLLDQILSPTERSTYWYKKIYYPNQEKPQIIIHNENLILYRDLFIGCILILIGLVSYKIFYTAPNKVDINGYIYIINAVFIVIINIAARNASKRLVVNAVNIDMATRDS